jgi:hypothetical protein
MSVVDSTNTFARLTDKIPPDYEVIFIITNQHPWMLMDKLSMAELDELAGVNVDQSWRVLASVLPVI